MDKTSILLIGIGRAGNVLTNEMLQRDKRYVGFMINSSLSDMIDLSNYKIADNYSFPGVDGSGKSREKAKEFVKKRVQSIIDKLLKYNQQKNVVIFTSADGGTGSGSSPLIAKALKHACPEKNIMLVVVMPKLSENELAISNAIGFWKDLTNLKRNKIINNFLLIDNNKRRTYEEINKDAIDCLDKAFSLNTFDTTGTIDQDDSEIINMAEGYNLILPLSQKYNKLNDAIDQAIKETVFMPPSIYECLYVGALTQKEIYNSEKLKTMFKINKASYCGFSKSENIIVFSGLSSPKEGIEILEMAYNDIKKENIQFNNNDLYEIKIDNPKEDQDKEQAKNSSIKNSTISSNDLKDLFDDNFWDD